MSITVSDFPHLRQWVVWRGVRRLLADGTEKVSKVPFTPGTNRQASVTDPGTWGTYAAALADVVAGNADGTGFVFTAGDDLFGIDLDDCRDPNTGIIEPWAQTIIERFGTYAELSPSSSGVHLIGRGRKPGTKSTAKPPDGSSGNIEAYDNARFFTVTGDVLSGYESIRDCQDVLTAWYRETWREAAAASSPSSPSSPTLAQVSDDVDGVIWRLRAERGGKGARLLSGDWSGYATPSEARWGLSSKAAFYGGDAEIITEILLHSGLFEPGDGTVERERRARHDAAKMAATYTGARFDPNHRRASDPDAHDTPGAAAIIANAELGPLRLTAWGIVTDIAGRVAMGEPPERHGYRVTNGRIVELTAQKPRTISRHIGELKASRLVNIQPHPVATTRRYHTETIAGDTGEIFRTSETVRGKRTLNFLTLPPDGVIGLIANLVAWPHAPATHDDTPGSHVTLADSEEHRRGCAVREDRDTKAGDDAGSSADRSHADLASLNPVSTRSASLA